MAKCGICKSKKGKRLCQKIDQVICSTCCGETRDKEECSECKYFKKTDAVRDYKKVPSFTVTQMNNNMELENYSNAIEGALCKFDIDLDRGVNDGIAIKILERLIDKYHFGDNVFEFESVIVKNGFNFVDQVIQDDLSDLENDVIVKTLGVVRYVAARRTQGEREYMDIIHQYVGPRLGNGVRVLKI